MPDFSRACETSKRPENAESLQLSETTEAIMGAAIEVHREFPAAERKSQILPR